MQQKIIFSYECNNRHQLRSSPNATPAEIADERVRLANEFDRNEIDDAVFYIERELFN